MGSWERGGHDMIATYLSNHGQPQLCPCPAAYVLPAHPQIVGILNYFSLWILMTYIVGIRDDIVWNVSCCFKLSRFEPCMRLSVDVRCLNWSNLATLLVKIGQISNMFKTASNMWRFVCCVILIAFFSWMLTRYVCYLLFLFSWFNLFLWSFLFKLKDTQWSGVCMNLNYVKI
jgi:hypothetical protein